MPLLSGKANIGQNIATEKAAGKSRAQSVAIALSVARKSGIDIPRSVKMRRMKQRSRNGY